MTFFLNFFLIESELNYFQILLIGFVVVDIADLFDKEWIRKSCDKLQRAHV